MVFRNSSWPGGKRECIRRRKYKDDPAIDRANELHVWRRLRACALTTGEAGRRWQISAANISGIIFLVVRCSGRGLRVDEGSYRQKRGGRREKIYIQGRGEEGTGGRVHAINETRIQYFEPNVLMPREGRESRVVTMHDVE
jgi:hypothetical protein